MTGREDHDLFPVEDLGVVWSPTAEDKHAAWLAKHNPDRDRQVGGSSDSLPPEVWYS